MGITAFTFDNLSSEVLMLSLWHTWPNALWSGHTFRVLVWESCQKGVRQGGFRRQFRCQFSTPNTIKIQIWWVCWKHPNLKADIQNKRSQIISGYLEMSSQQLSGTGMGKGLNAQQSALSNLWPIYKKYSLLTTLDSFQIFELFEIASFLTCNFVPEVKILKSHVFQIVFVQLALRRTPVASSNPTSSSMSAKCTQQ